MKARFIGSDDPGENRVCEVFGATFPIDEWVEVDAKAFRKLMGNPAFETDADGDTVPDPSVEEMRAELERLGVKYHHKAGPEKLAELLATARATPEPDPEPEPEA